MISMPQIEILLFVQYSLTLYIDGKNLISILFAVPCEPKVAILFFLPGGSTRKTSLRLKAAADLTIVPKFLAFYILNIIM